MLFESLTLGNLTLQNRIIMAPLTRMRAKDNIPSEINAKYYEQRASAGLIISEACQISQEGQGYPLTPGIYSREQVDGWKLVTDKVHKKNGKIFLQLWHVGRISHSSYQPNGGLPVAPSSIKPSGKVMASSWKQVEYETPRELNLNEIKALVQTYKNAAINAKEAGFDGVEVHSANGYLLDQFLQDGSNKRSDEYGGSIENRARLLIEVTSAAIDVFGKDRVGVRLSPYGTFNDMKDSDPIKLFSYVVSKLNELQIAYIHMIEPRATSAGGSETISESAPNVSKIFKPLFNRVFISAGGYTKDLAETALLNKEVDAVAFGRLFISNPDLPLRFKENKPLNPYNRATFYGGTEVGYTDYPFLEK